VPENRALELNTKEDLKKIKKHLKICRWAIKKY
jgi:GTP:adenosylcobinamide-phosphate guanylyltransferase